LAAGSSATRGYAAASVRRGLDFVQVPTSLLAQVDSSVGGKTGINSRHGKNLVGAFHQPILVIAIPRCSTRYPGANSAPATRSLQSSACSAMRASLRGWKPTGRICSMVAGARARDRGCVRGKAAVVARDERETGERALLNLGHTFGHAFEAAAGFSTKLLHGEAVSIGMACAFEFSAKLGLLPQADADRAIRHLAAVDATHIKDVPAVQTNADALMALMAQDKKCGAASSHSFSCAASGRRSSRRRRSGRGPAFLAEKLK